MANIVKINEEYSNFCDEINEDFDSYLVSCKRKIKGIIDEDRQDIKWSLNRMVNMLGDELSLRGNIIDQLRYFVFDESDFGLRYFDKLSSDDLKLAQEVINNTVGYVKRDIINFFGEFPGLEDGNYRLNTVREKFCEEIRYDYKPKYYLDETVYNLSRDIARKLGIERGSYEFDTIRSIVRRNYATIYDECLSRRTDLVVGGITSDFDYNLNGVIRYFKANPFTINQDNIKLYQTIASINDNYSLKIFDGDIKVSKDGKPSFRTFSTFEEGILKIEDHDNDLYTRVYIGDKGFGYEQGTLTGEKYLSMSYDSNTQNFTVVDFVNRDSYTIDSFGNCLGIDGYTGDVLDINELSKNQPNVFKFVQEIMSNNVMEFANTGKKM